MALNTPKTTFVRDIDVREKAMIVDVIGELARPLGLPKPATFAEASAIIERAMIENKFFPLLAMGLLVGRSTSVADLRTKVAAVKNKRLIVDFSQTNLANVLRIQ